MDHLFTIKEAAEESGYDERQIMYKIRKQRIEGAKKVGWIWVIPRVAVEQLKLQKRAEDEKRKKRRK